MQALVEEQKSVVRNSEIPFPWFRVSHGLIRVEVTPEWGGTDSLRRDVARPQERLPETQPERASGCGDSGIVAGLSKRSPPES